MGTMKGEAETAATTLSLIAVDNMGKRLIAGPKSACAPGSDRMAVALRESAHPSAPV